MVCSFKTLVGIETCRSPSAPLPASSVDHVPLMTLCMLRGSGGDGVCVCVCGGGLIIACFSTIKAFFDR